MATKLKAAGVSITVNVVLLISKIVVATITGSISLFAESAHSLFDLFASVLAYLGIKKAEEPSDEGHHYGHYKFENLSGLLQALLITGTAFVVIFESYQKLIHPSPVENSVMGVVLMAITIPVTYLTSRYLSHTAEHAGGSQALEADAAHFTTDVLGSIAVLVGLVFVTLGYPIGDPLAAMVVGLVMLGISITLAKESFIVFMDYSPDKATLARIKRVIASDRRVKSYHNLKARMAGSKIFVDVHLRLAKNMTVKESHTIAHQIKKSIIAAVPQVADVTTHIEPD